MLFCAASTFVAPSISAQGAAAYRVEEVSYDSRHDSTLLTASLALPEGEGPHRGVVLLSVAGTDRLVERLVGEGFVVLTPVRRGFVAVEPLLRARYSDLAEDLRAALTYLGTREEVGSSLGIVAQADDTPPAMLLAAASGGAVPLVLIAPPAFPGRETFRLEQRGIAERLGVRPADLEALDEYVERIADMVVTGDAPYVRQYRLEGLRAGSSVQLPRNAAFPHDERQMHFFASPLWHDRMAFEPEKVLAQFRSPILILIGSEDPNTPMDAYLEAVQRGLSSASSVDATVCLIEGRTRHTFTPQGVSVISGWLMARVGVPTERRVSETGLPVGCLEDAAAR